jgi:hypothetical protein
MITSPHSLLKYIQVFVEMSIECTALRERMLNVARGNANCVLILTIRISKGSVDVEVICADCEKPLQ